MIVKFSGKSVITGVVYIRGEASTNYPPPAQPSAFLTEEGEPVLADTGQAIVAEDYNV